MTALTILAKLSSMIMMSEASLATSVPAIPWIELTANHYIYDKKQPALYTALASDIIFLLPSADLLQPLADLCENELVAPDTVILLQVMRLFVYALAHVVTQIPTIYLPKRKLSYSGLGVAVTGGLSCLIMGI
jgi:uncharacterized membrane protein YGL010W